MTTGKDIKIVLFLGGPLHGEYREVSSTATHYYIPVFNPPAVSAAYLEFPSLEFDRVEYRFEILRSAKGPECVSVGIDTRLSAEELSKAINEILGGF